MAKEFNPESSSVWREILSRWGQADYDDLTKRAEHQATLKAEYDTQEYARKRAVAYPEIGDQLDALYHDMTSGKGDKTGEWYKTIKKVKDDNPKPE